MNGLWQSVISQYFTIWVEKYTNLYKLSKSSESVINWHYGTTTRLYSALLINWIHNLIGFVPQSYLTINFQRSVGNVGYLTALPYSNHLESSKFNLELKSYTTPVICCECNPPLSDFYYHIGPISDSTARWSEARL